MLQRTPTLSRADAQLELHYRSLEALEALTEQRHSIHRLADEALHRMLDAGTETPVNDLPIPDRLEHVDMDDEGPGGCDRLVEDDEYSAEFENDPEDFE